MEQIKFNHDWRVQYWLHVSRFRSMPWTVWWKMCRNCSTNQRPGNCGNSMEPAQKLIIPREAHNECIHHIWCNADKIWNFIFLFPYLPLPLVVPLAPPPFWPWPCVPLFCDPCPWATVSAWERCSSWLDESWNPWRLHHQPPAQLLNGNIARD